MRRRHYLDRTNEERAQEPRLIKLPSDLEAEYAAREAAGIPHPGPDHKVHRQRESDYDGRGYTEDDVD